MIDECGNTLESTYPKRAKQLVKHQRALWVNSDSIQLQSQSEKDFIMEPSKITQVESENTQQVINILKNDSQEVIEDEAIMELAKERIRAKRILKRKGRDLILLAFMLLIIAATYDEALRFCIAFVYGFSWLVRYTIKVVQFAKPSFVDGISEHLKRRKEIKINAEYLHIKQMIEAGNNIKSC